MVLDVAVGPLDFGWLLERDFARLPELDFARLPELDLRRAVGFERAADLVEAPDFVAPDFVEPLDLFEPLALVEPLVFAAPLALVERLPVLFARGEEPLDELPLDRLRGLLEVGLPFAILIPLLVRGTASLTVGLPAIAAANPRPDGRSRRKQ